MLNIKIGDIRDGIATVQYSSDNIPNLTGFLEVQGPRLRAPNYKITIEERESPPIGGRHVAISASLPGDNGFLKGLLWPLSGENRTPDAGEAPEQ